MRKISLLAANALLGGNSFRRDNTIVENNAMYLFDNTIAYWENRKMYISCAGYPTKTTMERLNTLLYRIGRGERLRIRRGTMYYGDRTVSPYIWIEVAQYTRPTCIYE